jgi:uncharacterized membrane protein YfcA
MGIFLTIIIGLFAGTVSGLLGIGGGSIIVPGLFLFGIVGIKKAIGISLAVMIPAAMASLIKHNSDRVIDYKILPALCLGALLGAYIGADLSDSLQPVLLKKILAVSLIVIGINTVFNLTGRLRMVVNYNQNPDYNHDVDSVIPTKQEIILFYEI